VDAVSAFFVFRAESIFTLKMLRRQDEISRRKHPCCRWSVFPLRINTLGRDLPANPCREMLAGVLGPPLRKHLKRKCSVRRPAPRPDGYRKFRLASARLRAEKAGANFRVAEKAGQQT
jgi:hypothetical protein